MDETRVEERLEHWIPCETYVRYAESDLTRWRQIVGCRVQSTDSKWGEGVVETVSWGSCCDGVRPTIQIKIRYEIGWAATSRAETWQLHHRSVAVSSAVDSVIRTCFDPALSEDERSECLARHARELRDEQDRAALDRASRMRQRALDRREGR